MAIYIVSRTICGYLLGWFNSFELEANPVVASVAALCVTLGSQFLVMFFAPPTGIVAFLSATVGSACVNALLAAPLFMILRQILGGRRL